ncbi:hypothetical protein [Nocardia rhizosphaerihabitans]|uniref:DUF420 domain-containing protein n=1 Tax=Nocardia rhizosphaerihabitans TaxID=1691570 RepID=A0ABQ2KHC8_9NOCA|nr:hypothetical protein [Nocardia rhizosphaerihabitans]GGN81711.1 hypothetical protein GCM10011610_32360 [Nocardia rhizosphaerihabitans]
MTGRGGGIGRTIAYGLLALPLALAPVRTRLRVPRRLLHEPVSAHGVSAVRCVFHSVLSAGVGIVAWFLIMLTALGLVRGLAYPLVAAGDYETSWGGPTLAGAWLVHAAVGLVIAPVFLGIVTLLGRLQLRSTRTVLGRAGSWWVIPAAVVLTVAGALFFAAWVRQI